MKDTLSRLPFESTSVNKSGSPDHSSIDSFEVLTDPSVLPVIWACPKIYRILLATITVIVVNTTRCNINESLDVNVSAA